MKPDIPFQPIDLHVCVTCQQNDAADTRPGVTLHRNMETALAQRHDLSPVRLHPVECLCVCTRPCTVAVSSPGKWTYIIAGLDPILHMESLFGYLDAYAASPTGTPSLKSRPAAIRAGTIARFPPAQPS